MAAPPRAAQTAGTIAIIQYEVRAIAIPPDYSSTFRKEAFFYRQKQTKEADKVIFIKYTPSPPAITSQAANPLADFHFVGERSIRSPSKRNATGDGDRMSQRPTSLACRQAAGLHRWSSVVANAARLAVRSE